MIVFVVALAGANTRHVHVSWVLGSASVSFVWLVLIGAALGWLLGMVTNSFLRWHTRAPSPRHPARP